MERTLEMNAHLPREIANFTQLFATLSNNNVKKLRGRFRSAWICKSYARRWIILPSLAELSHRDEVTRKKHEAAAAGADQCHGVSAHEPSTAPYG
jgi:hypothetical protein